MPTGSEKCGPCPITMSAPASIAACAISVMYSSTSFLSPQWKDATRTSTPGRRDVVGEGAQVGGVRPGDDLGRHARPVGRRDLRTRLERRHVIGGVPADHR